MKISQLSCQVVAIIFPQSNLLTLKDIWLGQDSNSRTFRKNKSVTCLNQLSYRNRQEKNKFLKLRAWPREKERERGEEREREREREKERKKERYFYKEEEGGEGER